jgi:hypothetical protein
LIDEIDVDNWVIDDIEEPKEFQTNPPSLDVKQTHVMTICVLAITYNVLW